MGPELLHIPTKRYAPKDLFAHAKPNSSISLSADASAGSQPADDTSSAPVSGLSAEPHRALCFAQGGFGGIVEKTARINTRGRYCGAKEIAVFSAHSVMAKPKGGVRGRVPAGQALSYGSPLGTSLKDAIFMHVL